MGAKANEIRREEEPEAVDGQTLNRVKHGGEV